MGRGSIAAGAIAARCGSRPRSATGDGRRATGDGLRTAQRCTCSFCRMRGAVVVSAGIGGLRLLQGEDMLARYRFNTGAARHFFRSRCGIHTHHQSRSNPARYGVNVACLDKMSSFDFAEVPVLDGVRHPNDTGGGAAGRNASLPGSGLIVL